MQTVRIIATLALATLTLAACATGGMPPPKPAAAASSSPVPMPRPAPDAVRLLDFPRGAIHVLADDLDGDGRTDLAFTSHGGNRTDLFLATGSREFRKAQTLPEVGFHPNDFIRWPWGETPHWLSVAEGKSRLVAFGRDGSDLSVVAEHRADAPRSAAPFTWPGSGRSLAVSPYSGKNLSLFLDFDPVAGPREILTIETGASLGPVTSADLGRGDVLLTTHYGEGRLWGVYPGSGDRPDLRLLWEFDPGMIPVEARAVDLDGDGLNDLLVRLEAGQRIAPLFNRGDRFEAGEFLVYPGRGGPSTLAAARDGDGSLLVATGGTDETTTLFRLPAGADAALAASWERYTIPTRGIPDSIALSDLDGDGRLDMAVARSGGPRFKDSAVVLYGPLEKHWSLLEGL